MDLSTVDGSLNQAALTTAIVWQFAQSMLLRVPMRPKQRMLPGSALRFPI
jgi:hypothetical protein